MLMKIKTRKVYSLSNVHLFFLRSLSQETFCPLLVSQALGQHMTLTTAGQTSSSSHTCSTCGFFQVQLNVQVVLTVDAKSQDLPVTFPRAHLEPGYWLVVCLILVGLFFPENNN